jgi:hypothetical protein
MKSKSYCTSLNCTAKLDINSYCRECSHARWSGSATVNGREWRWVFSYHTGVLFLTAKKSERKRYPGERHPVWTAVDRWYRRKFRVVKK